MLDVDEVRKFTGLLDADEVDDELLESLERSAIADFQRETNRYVGPPAAITDLLHGGRRGSAYLWLTAPYLSLTSVEVMGWGAYWTMPWTVGEFDYSPARGLYFLNGGWFPAGSNNIRVTYQGGYAPGTEPADLRAEIAERVAMAYRRRPSATPMVLEPGQQPSLGVGQRSSRAARWYRNPGL